MRRPCSSASWTTFARKSPRRKRPRAASLSLKEKLDIKKEVAALKAKATVLKRTHFDRLEEIGDERDRLLEEVEGKLQLIPMAQPLLEVRWILA